MKRLKHIDARLSRWARWCESGGRLSVAPFARGQRVDGGRSEHDAALIHGEEWETDQMVRLLLFAEQAIVTALYRARFEMLELAAGKSAPAARTPLMRVCKLLGIGTEAIRWQLTRIDRALDAMVRARREGRDIREALRQPGRRPGGRTRALVNGRLRTVAATAPADSISLLRSDCA